MCKSGMALKASVAVLSCWQSLCQARGGLGDGPEMILLNKQCVCVLCFLGGVPAFWLGHLLSALGVLPVTPGPHKLLFSLFPCYSQSSGSLKTLQTLVKVINLGQ